MEQPGGGRAEIVRLVKAALRARGVDPAPAIARAGPGPSAPHLLIEFAAQACRDDVFGLRLVDHVEPRNWGLFFYLVGSSSSVREALSLAAGNTRLLNPSLNPVLTFEADGSAAWDNRYRDVRRAELRHAVEFSYAFMTRLFRGFAGPGFGHGSVEFRHERTTGLEAFERFFRCPVLFGAAADRVTFPRETLDLPLLTADLSLHATLERLARKVDETRSAEIASHRAAVETALQRLLPAGSVSIDAVAAALGASARSLTRKLASERTTFSAVLDDLRRTLTRQHLAREDLTLGQIAHLVGYEDPGAFAIAFRRWTGVSPSQARGDPAVLNRLAAPASR